ncbi:glycosyltransferase [Curvibacter sp. CHRR-16]|uniref:glycosyltransferase family 2 protein n=1 Tax=Curvibacter sp. CHRR-16 TaxID=2835872 RepID=UPI001BDAB75A|nr:glycosyltransferase family 2 protein [Curvibacter sp. CHRR-16]MBT0571754.1 glycosyltransferase [Curvibacter sp. CHRR-16]
MKITVITVCYNSAATIVDTLQSVASQETADIEHIIVDGGSTDGTQALVHQHAREGYRMLSEPDQGIYDAMNKGVSMASGDVIAFLNADDVYVGSHALMQVGDYMSKTNVDALYGDTEFVRPDNLNKPIRRYRSDHFSPSKIAWGWMPAHPALFLRREIFERYGNFCVDYRIAGDFELVARIFHKGDVTYKHIPQVMVRMRTGGVSTRGLRSIFLLNQEVLRACKSNGIHTNWFMILSKYPAKLIEFLHR